MILGVLDQSRRVLVVTGLLAFVEPFDVQSDGFECYGFLCERERQGLFMAIGDIEQMKGVDWLGELRL